MVARLCQLLPSLDRLEILRLSSWSCSRFGLFSQHNQRQGFSLSFLPNLTRLSVRDVKEEFFVHLGSSCPNLLELRVSS